MIRVCATCKHRISPLGRKLQLDSGDAEAVRTHGMCGVCYLAGATSDEEYLRSLADLIDVAREEKSRIFGAKVAALLSHCVLCEHEKHATTCMHCGCEARCE